MTYIKNTILEQVISALATLRIRQLAEINISNSNYGDYATNLALMLAKPTAQQLVSALPAEDAIYKVEIAGPGFVNFFASAEAAASIIEQVISHCERLRLKHVLVEFVSANPTGPLHVGHGRGAVVGDCICRMLESTGHSVTREFYYNDTGVQIKNLTRSVAARINGIQPNDYTWPKDGYHGNYIIDVAHAFYQQNAYEETGEFAIAYIRGKQYMSINALNISFDVYFLESSLYMDGKIEATVELLVEHTYESDGALWLKTTEFGDDKDRVILKSDGNYTYFLIDVAYHHDKWRRGFTTVINEQGADHHSTIVRVRAGLQAIGIKVWPDYVLHQMVTVMRCGEEVKLSKRAGSYITLLDLIKEVGCDATRYFLAARNVDSQLTFDISLAREQSSENPVYYIQYASARVSSVLRAVGAVEWADTKLSLLIDSRERMLVKRLAAYSEVLLRAAIAREPHHIAQYLHYLAADFHVYYNTVQIIVDNKALRNARLALSIAVRQVIRNGLNMLGVSAPEDM